MSKQSVLLVTLSLLQMIVQCQKCTEERIGSYAFSSGMKWNCTDINGSFPKPTRAVISLKCKNCDIPTLDENTISNFQGDTFNISYSHVKIVAATALNSFKKFKLRILLLNDNEITSIAPNLFSNFSTLDEINFRNNKLTKLEDGTFENTNVTSLDLSQNHISNIGNIFSGLRVSKLNLSSNGIIEIPEDAFDNTVFGVVRQWGLSSQTLDLSLNLIENINPKTFQMAKSSVLEFLYLKGNKITNIDNDTFSQLNYLTYLSLEDNIITELYTNSFKGLSKLNTLVLKTNYIKEIPRSMFANLLNLGNLDISGNPIETLNEYTFSGLANLITLNISYTNLKVLKEIHLLPMGKLMKLDVSNNALKTLNLSSIMEHHFKLKLVVINDNYWSCKDLVQMYKILNKETGGFHFPSHHFDVPNLHGIACSRTDAEVYNYKSFDDFLSIISQDQLIEDLYESKLTNGLDLSTRDVLTLVKTINGIFYMILTILLMFMILFLQFIARHVCNYLYNHNIILSDRFSLKYAQNQDSVVLI